MSGHSDLLPSVYPLLHSYSRPLFPAVFPAQMAAADGRVGVCLGVCVCVCTPVTKKEKKKACMCITHTWDVHTPEHQWGNPCLSVSSVLSVLLRLRSHCNSVWSWLPRCHSHIHARTVPNTNTLQLCEIQLQNRKILGEKTDSRHKKKQKKNLNLNSFYNDGQYAQTIFAHRGLNWEKNTS